MFLNLAPHRFENPGVYDMSITKVVRSLRLQTT